MSDDLPVSLLWGVGALVLVLSALSARRVSVGTVVRSLLAWAVIAAVLWVAIANRYEIGRFFGALGTRLGIADQQVAGDTVRIRQSPDGHFWARVRINGVERRMLVDSGATLTAIAPETARAAGIALGDGRVPVLISTANGTVEAERGRAERVSLAGALETRDLGIVTSPAFGDTEVLGMNFLSRLGSWRVEGDTLILEPDRPGEDAGAGAAASAPQN